MTRGFFAGLAALVVRFRLLVIAVWAVVLVGAFLALPSLGSQANSDTTAFLSSSAKSVEAQSLGISVLGSTSRSRITIVAARQDGPLTQADLAAVSREAKLAEHVSGVVAQAKRSLVTSAGGSAISPDGKAVQFTVTVGEPAKNVAQLRKVVSALQATFPQAHAPAGLQLHLAGNVATNAANNASGNKATSRIGIFSILFIIVLLLIVLRSPVAAAITFLPSVVALLTSERLIAGLGTSGLQISSVTQTLLVVLILGAGTDYGLFLTYRFREELRDGTEPRAAVTAALTRVGASITASAGTVILALLTLLFASFGLYHDLGVPLAVGIAVMLLAGLTLLPALLAVAARFAFPGVAGAGNRSETKDGIWGRAAGRAVRRPLLTLGAGVLIFAALALAALGYRTAGLNRSATAPAGSDAAAGNALLAGHFRQLAVNPARLVLEYPAPVWQHSGELAEAEQSLRASGLFAELAGPLNGNGGTLTAAAYSAARAELGSPQGLPLAEPPGLRIPRSTYDAYRASAQYVSQNGQIVQFLGGLRAGSQTSTPAMDATPAVRMAVADAARRSGAVASGVTGQAAALYDVSSTANSDIATIIPVAVLAIALLLVIVLRSLVAPVYLVVSVVLSYLAALGVTTLLVIDLGGQDGLVFVLPFLMFVFLLALGEDYNILIMTRIREEARHLGLREAVVRAIGRTGPTVTSAGLILAGTFGVFAVAGGGVMGGQLQAIGLGLALGVLMDTFIVRTLLVPSAAVLLGRWNWWPSQLSRRDGPPPAAPALPAIAPESATTAPVPVAATPVRARAARGGSMFFTYLRRELRRRMRQAIFIALGLALGVGLVITVTAASDGVKNSQATVLHTLYGVGTDVTVTKPPSAGTSSAISVQFRQEIKAIRNGAVAAGTTINENELLESQYGVLSSRDLATVARQRDVTAAAGGLTLTDVTVNGTVPSITVGSGGGSLASSFSYGTVSVDGVDLANRSLGPLSAGKLTSGSDLNSADATAADAVIDSGYAAASKLGAGSTVDVGGTSFKVIGTVSAPEGGNPPDIYIPLAKAQSIGKLGSASLAGDVDTIYVSAASAADITAVQQEIHKALPSATVTDSSALASQVTGSISSAATLANDLGRWLSVAVLIAAFGLASLLTTAAVARRVREFGTLKALGWQSRRIVGQVIGESLAIGLAGAAAGVGLGYAGAALIEHLAPSLTATVGPSSPASVSASGSALGGGARNALKSLTPASSHTVSVPLTAPVTVDLILLAVALALAGGLIAGLFGGWRAARLRPAAALARVE